MTAPHRSLSLLALFAGTSVACGTPQASDSYEGEPLLRISGSIVTTAEAPLTGDVVPAIGWTVGTYQGDFETVLVQETRIAGEFPAGFTMDLLLPPPGEVPRGAAIKGFESEPSTLFGNIVALPRDHEPYIYLGYERNPVDESCIPDANGDVCTSTYCDYYEECFTERCNITTDECTLLDGTAQVRAGLGVAAGFVDEYLVLYLDRPAQAGSVTAYRLGEDQLAAGFHLLKLEESELSDADYDCRDQAFLRARADFEQAYGVSSDEVDDESPLLDALDTYEQAAALAAGCKAAPLGRIVAGDDQLVMKLSTLDENE